MLGTLNPCGGGDPIPLHKQTLVVGRRSRCDVTLRFANVSSHHCQLDFLNGYWRVRDLGSRNGIKVNGERCEQKWLMPGDVLHVAKHLFSLDYQPTGDGPPPDDDHDMFEMSLMEKAGLEAPARPRAQMPPAAKPLPQEPAPTDTPETEEDLAVNWLLED